MIQLCPDNTVLTKSAIHDIGKHFTKQSFIYFSELNFRSFSYNHFPKDSFLNKVVSTLRTKKNTKVESSLLQTDILTIFSNRFKQNCQKFLHFHRRQTSCCTCSTCYTTFSAPPRNYIHKCGTLFCPAPNLFTTCYTSF